MRDRLAAVVAASCCWASAVTSPAFCGAFATFLAGFFAAFFFLLYQQCKMCGFYRAFIYSVFQLGLN